MSKLIIYGTGGHSRVVADIVRAQGTVDLLAYIDDDEERCGRTITGVPVMAPTSLDGWLDRGCEVVVALGDNPLRRRIAEGLLERGYPLARLVHPTATIAADVPIGAGTVILPGAIINVGTSIGQGVIINTGAIIDHDCTIGDYCHIAPGVRLAGTVQVGRGALLGIGSCAIPGVAIGEESCVGAGAVVLRNIPDGTTVAGNPARPISAT